MTGLHAARSRPRPGREPSERMPRRRRAPVVASLSVLAALVAIAGPPLVADGEPQAAATPAARGSSTNTVLVVVDDMRDSEMSVLPDTRRWLAGDGVRFANAYAPTPLCCPARASLLTGQYAHNTGVLDNTARGPFPGGFDAFDDSRTLATVLAGAGVTTGYIGKYLNGYSSLYVPPGWDEWVAGVLGQYRYRTQVRRNPLWRYEGRTVYNVNGAYVTKLGYETSVQTNLATAFIRDHADEPFFLTLNYLAPHGNLTEAPGFQPPKPHESHEHDFDGYRIPRTAAYNEADVSDKPPFAQFALMTPTEKIGLDDAAEARLESLRSVDDGMRAIRAALRRQGVLDQTNVMFVSDNGFMLGEHRIKIGKIHAYEPSARVPLLMAGPGVLRQGVVRRVPVGLHDIASTVTQWFGLGEMPGADGRPLVGPGGASRDILLQGSFDRAVEESYTGLRTHDGYKYVEFLEGSVELYDLTADPLELTNLSGDDGYARLQRHLHRRLVQLRDCARASCQ